MERLRINNFLGLNTEIEIKDINIFIGAQATGKSVIAKLIYFFKSFCGLLEEVPPNVLFLTKEVLDLRNFLENQEVIKNLFYYYFPMEYLGKSDFLIEYQKGKYEITISRESGKMIVKLSEDFLQEYEKLVKENIEWEKEQKKNTKTFIDNEPLILNPQLILEREIRETFGFPPLIYLPAERAFLSVLGGNISKFIHSPTITPFLINFLRHVEVAIGRIFYIKEPFNDPFLEELSARILKGKLIESQRRGELVIIPPEEDRETALYLAASGVQTSVPAILIIKRLLLELSYDNKLLTPLLWLPNNNKPFVAPFLFFEEPEAHLFPEAHNDFVQLLIWLHSKTSTKLVISTHSPYILGALNNLIYAGVLKRKGKDISNILKQELAVPPEKVTAYWLEQGKAKNIIDKKSGLIHNEYIDSASDIINETFEKLFELEDVQQYKTKK